MTYLIMYNTLYSIIICSNIIKVQWFKALVGIEPTLFHFADGCIAILPQCQAHRGNRIPISTLQKSYVAITPYGHKPIDGIEPSLHPYERYVLPLNYTGKPAERLELSFHPYQGSFLPLKDTGKRREKDSNLHVLSNHPFSRRRSHHYSTNGNYFKIVLKFS